MFMGECLSTEEIASDVEEGVATAV